MVVNIKCGEKQNQKPVLINKIPPTKVNAKPRKSTDIPAIDESQGSVSYGTRSVHVLWQTINTNFQPV